MNQENTSTEQSKAVGANQSAEPKLGSTLADLDPRLDESSPDDDLAQYIEANWQKYVGGLVVLLVGVWLYNQYQTSREKETANASLRFSKLQSSFQDLAGTEAEGAKDKDAPENAAAAEKPASEKREDAEQEFKESLSLLRGKYEGSAYSGLADLYAAMREFNEGKFAAARDALASYSPEAYLNDSLNAPDAGSFDIEVFSRELAALLYLRSEIAEGKKSRDELFKSAETLISRARTIGTEAVVMLFRIAQSEAETERAKQAAELLSKNSPELAEPLRRELSGLGYSM